MVERKQKYNNQVQDQSSVTRVIGSFKGNHLKKNTFIAKPQKVN